MKWSVCFNSYWCTHIHESSYWVILMSHHLEGSVTFNIISIFRNSDGPSFASDSAAAQEFGNQSSQSFLKYGVISGQIGSFPVKSGHFRFKGEFKRSNLGVTETYHGISEIGVVIIGKIFHQLNSFVGSTLSTSQQFNRTEGIWFKLRSLANAL